MTANLPASLQTRLQKASHRAITFAEFMDWALYDPEIGYYSSGNVDIGAEGDFFTASSLSADFGELLAEQFMEMKTRLQINPFQIVEMGAGKGHLAKDILQYLQSHYPQDISQIEYIILEKSPTLRAQQQSHLADLDGIEIRWSDWSEIEVDSIEGCFFSNELIDAFPVHRVTVQNQQLQELYVSIGDESGDRLQEVSRDLSTSALTDYFQALGIEIKDYPDGFQTEVNLQMFDWLETVQSRLKQGYILSIDYGYPAEKYYHPQRSGGTLQCYFQHRHHNNPYVNLGQQDLTAHVDFTSLQRHGEFLDLRTIGLTQQGLFLMALGLGDRLNALSSESTDVMSLFRRRDALHQLINPGGLGEFYVLCQGKNLTSEQLAEPLKGFTHP